jgi:hypothetical protein
MAGVTNRGKLLLLQYGFRTSTRPANYYIALCTSANTPSAATNLLSDLVQIATGNGYSDGGYQLTPGDTDFDYQNEDDGLNLAQLQVKDVAWTASGNLPSSGNGARYAVLTTNEATVANRQVICYWDLVSDRAITNGQTLTLQNCEIDLTES